MFKIALMTKARFMLHKIKNEKGITLIEILVVLAIIAIVATLMAVGPEFSGTDRIRTASRELLSDLQWARQAAMTQGPGGTVPQLRGFGIRFESTNIYRIFRFNDTNTNFIYDAGEERSITDGEASPRQRDLYSTIQLMINSGGTPVSPNNDVLLFDRQGMPRQSNWSFSQITFVIQNPNNPGAQAKCVTVTFNRIREGVWSSGVCTEQ
jgi:prepilin-type N-terminal cleavage/methylation domain-containing protein